MPNKEASPKPAKSVTQSMNEIDLRRPEEGEVRSKTIVEESLDILTSNIPLAQYQAPIPHQTVKGKEVCGKGK
jgi:hypothetical protein